jgi:hypothetical protein
MTQESALRLGNPVAKKRVWLIASTAIKSRCAACTKQARKRNGDDDGGAYSYRKPRGCTCATTHPLRYAYDQARKKYAKRVYDEGPKVGEPWSAGHQHAAALRYVGKTFLRLLYDAAQDAGSHGRAALRGHSGCAPAREGEASASSSPRKKARR